MWLYRFDVRCENKKIQRYQSQYKLYPYLMWIRQGSFLVALWFTMVNLCVMHFTKMNFIVLQFNVLHITLMHSNALHCTVLNGNMLHFPLLYITVQHMTVMHLTEVHFTWGCEIVNENISERVKVQTCFLKQILKYVFKQV